MVVNRHAGRVEGQEYRGAAIYAGAVSSRKQAVWGYLTDDGSDSSLNENYASATDCYYTVATSPLVVTSICVSVEDTDIAQAAYGTFCGAVAAVTNGFKFKFVDSAGGTTLDLTTATATGGSLKSKADFKSVAKTFSEVLINTSATTAQNVHSWTAEFCLNSWLGAGVLLNVGDKLVCTLQDNYSGLTSMTITFKGYRV
jgi:hypothetical protein